MQWFTGKNSKKLLRGEGPGQNTRSWCSLCLTPKPSLPPVFLTVVTRNFVILGLKRSFFPKTMSSKNKLGRHWLLLLPLVYQSNFTNIVLKPWLKKTWRHELQCLGPFSLSKSRESIRLCDDTAPSLGRGHASALWGHANTLKRILCTTLFSFRKDTVKERKKGKIALDSCKSPIHSTFVLKDSLRWKRFWLVGNPSAFHGRPPLGPSSIVPMPAESIRWAKQIEELDCVF